ncbi:hypothetical protein [Lysobacter sp. CA199]|uniref:hypothetical protein n=1 Tax=Lysobacter sp. CA199 TaxID=3455608 RepID=UPI003F8D54E1
MRNRKLVLGLVLAAVSTIASASLLPPPGEIRSYYKDGVEVGTAIHDCYGNLRVTGTVTKDYYIGYLHCGH